MTEEPRYRTEQEQFWAGSFGNDYIERNTGELLLASNLNFFTGAMNRARDVRSCIEFGANIGMNLQAISLLFPQLDLHAVEINTTAVKRLAELVPPENIYHGSILDYEPERSWDLALIKGVLIHINPDFLPVVYDKLVRSTRRYLLVAEYYNPTPVTIPYRGQSDRLFKRDFAGEIMDLYPEFKLVDYGFQYRRDPNFPQDDISWFLMERS